MGASGQRMFHDILEECYDVELELEELGESYEIMLTDIELVIETIREDLERVQDHLQKVENAFNIYRRSVSEAGTSDPKELPWE